MDRNNIAICVSLDGLLLIDDEQHFLDQKDADRFVVFVNINWQGQGKPDDPPVGIVSNPTLFDVPRNWNRRQLKVRQGQDLQAIWIELQEFRRNVDSHRRPVGIRSGRLVGDCVYR